MIYAVNYVLKIEKLKTYTEEFHTLSLAKKFVESLQDKAQQILVHKVDSSGCENRLIYKLDNVHYSTYAEDEYSNEQ